MIKSITMKHGAPGAYSETTLSNSSLTVFVGPNNSGKSLMLRELHRGLNGFIRHNKILKAINYEHLELEEVFSFLQPYLIRKEVQNGIEYVTYERPPLSRDKDLHEHEYISTAVEAIKTNLERDRELASNGYPVNNGYLEHMLSLSVLKLDGKTRFELIKEQPAGNLNAAPQNHLQAIFQDFQKVKAISELTYEALGLYFVLDPTNLGTLHIKLSKDPPKQEVVYSLMGPSRAYFSEARSIDEFSDGVQAFIGILCSIFSTEFRFIIVDEPEAFLHPPLARLLGRELSQLSRERGCKVFASTHSLDFVSGCISSGVDVDIVRLSYQNETSKVHILNSSELKRLMRDSLVRSSGLLNGLFHQSVVITESDTDKAFYQEINDRILQDTATSLKGIKDGLFLYARNKQTEWSMVAPLRKLGIPAAAIVDLDIFKEGGVNWQRLLEACGVDYLHRESFGVLRSRISKLFTDDMKSQGVESLEGEDKSACELFIRQLAQYGVFVVPCGELESWLRYLGVQGHGPYWLIPMFEKLGDDPASSAYVAPQNNDVWSFISQIAEWFNNPYRLGMNVK